MGFTQLIYAKITRCASLPEPLARAGSKIGGANEQLAPATSRFDLTYVVEHLPGTNMKPIHCLIITLGLLITLSCRENQSTRETSRPANRNFHEIMADFETTLSQDLVMKHHGSFSAAVFKADKIIWSKAFGKADDGKGINADTSTVYRIGSISKTITAYLMLVMVQNGVIRLDDPVARYLPEIKLLKQNGTDVGGDITFRQLADHTSGLEREPDWPYAATGPIETWENKVLNSIPATTLHPPVGKTFSYSNIGYAILGLAISRAAHKPFMDSVEEWIFRPHGMTNSFYSMPRAYENRIAVGYSWNSITMTYDSGQSQKELAGRGYKVPNGGVFTTANDLARFAMSLTADSDLLARKNRDLMQTIQTPESSDRGYGFGLNIVNNYNGIRMVGHNGLVAGYSAYMVFNPGSGIGVVLLRNCDDAAPLLESQGNNLLTSLVTAN
jgi:CubicO group peptidase (beta-lactamase class C family)